MHLFDGPRLFDSVEYISSQQVVVNFVERHFQCNDCDRSFNSEPRLIFHRKASHKEYDESISNEVSEMASDRKDQQNGDDFKVLERHG